MAGPGRSSTPWTSPPVAQVMFWAFPCPSHGPSQLRRAGITSPWPGCPSGMASADGVTAQRGTKLQPPLFDPLRQEWLPRSPLRCAHLHTLTCAQLPVPGVRERLCSHIPHRPGLVQRQPSPGMTWIHFKSAVTHPGLAPGLSAHLLCCCRPHGPSPTGMARCWGLPELPPCPPYRAAHSARAVTACSPHCAPLAQSSMGPRRLFPAADRMALAAGAMFPQQLRHTQPCAGSLCCSSGPDVGPGTGDGSVLAVAAPEHTTSSSSLLPASWITTAGPHGSGSRGHMSRASCITSMRETRKTGTAAGTSH